ncbi:hypothetical protein [Noviluteimonas gilva]|uniref:Helix-turn-helix domain-containing protein n=1 Tax=Noviluteimonas gilva TaxID=2682097 RepID=A0A7C9LYT5_9GAMM|nr:hypothetical protein [Lysobacter gilvus]MUV15425.1 hypothetical protein [Lysobacter gilvus]
MKVDLNKVPRSSKRRARNKGRQATKPFVGIPHEVLNSLQFGALSAHATKLLIELARQFRGKNNGDFSASYTQVKKRGWHSPSTLDRAKKELLASGFIMLTRQGGRHRCSLYAVTWWPIDECGGKHHEPPTTVAPNWWRDAKVVVQDRTNVVPIRTKTSIRKSMDADTGPDVYESHRAC